MQKDCKNRGKYNLFEKLRTHDSKSTARINVISESSAAVSTQLLWQMKVTDEISVNVSLRCRLQPEQQQRVLQNQHK